MISGTRAMRGILGKCYFPTSRVGVKQRNVNNCWIECCSLQRRLSCGGRWQARNFLEARKLRNLPVPRVARAVVALQMYMPQPFMCNYVSE